MKVLHAFNSHRGTWGSDKAWSRTIEISRAAGFDVAVFSRDSKVLGAGLQGKVRAFFSGIYAREAVRAFDATLAEVRPDVVHTHELFPFVSPWIHRRCAAAGVPVVHTCYDYRLTCPIATHFDGEAICTRCVGGREYNAFVRNCRGNAAESLAFALRSTVATRRGLFVDDVDQFIVLTEFGRDWLRRDVGIADDRITIQPCVIPLPESRPASEAPGAYVGFAGRLAHEKGAHVLIEAARRTGLPVRFAANAEGHPDIRPGDPISFVPTRNAEELADFYRGARMIVVPSIWNETFAIVAAEAMSHGTPVIASRIGALQHVVTGETGMLVEPGNVDELAAAMTSLWQDPARCRRLGAMGRQRVATHYGEETHLRQLRLAYGRARDRARL